MKTKRAFTSLMSASLAMSMAMTPMIAHAAPATQPTPGVYTSEGEGNVICKASVGENFTVTLPVTLTLNNNQAASLPVSVQGDLTAGQKVHVVPEDSVSMKYVTESDTFSKAPVVATVSAGKTVWSYEDLFGGETIMDNGTTVAVSGLTAGSWVGSLTYNISLEGGSDNSNLSTSDEGLKYESNDGGSYVVYADVANIVDLANSYSTLTINGEAIDMDKMYFNVNLPNDLTEIEENAFADAYYDDHAGDLTGTRIPASHISVINTPDRTLTSIGANAFAGTGIRIAYINAESVGATPFKNCSKLQSVKVDRIDNYANAETESFAKHVVSLNAIMITHFDGKDYGATTFGENCYTRLAVTAKNKDDLQGMPTEVTLPGSAAPININGYGITIPDGTTAVEDHAFDNCTYDITDVNFPDSVTSIGAYAFRGCHVERLWLPEHLQTISAHAFENCMMNTSGYTYDLVIPASVTSIGESAFSGVKHIGSVNLKNTAVTSLEKSAFENCENLASIELPAGLASIGEDVIGGSKITSVIIPNSVTTINSSAFATASNLTSIYYSGSVEDDGTHWGASGATIYANNSL